MTNHPEKPPFPDHRRYYLFVKIAVVAIAALLAARFFLGQTFAP
jgi:hypothetical protein